MRLIAFIVAALFVSGPAAAEWKDYNVIVEGFAVAFPNEPKVDEVAMYQIVPGKMVPAHVYTANYNKGVFKVTVADARDANLQEAPVLAQAMRQLTQGGGQVKFDIPHRIYRIYGRQLSVARPNGSLTTAAVFFANERLYMIESTRLQGGSDSDLIQFQQSLVFDRNTANRTPQQVEAIRAACLRGVAGNDRPGNPAGVGDPRCAQDN